MFNFESRTFKKAAFWYAAFWTLTFYNWNWHDFKMNSEIYAWSNVFQFTERRALWIERFV